MYFQTPIEGLLFGTSILISGWIVYRLITHFPTSPHHVAQQSKYILSNDRSVLPDSVKIVSVKPIERPQQRNRHGGHVVFTGTGKYECGLSNGLVMRVHALKAPQVGMKANEIHRDSLF